MKKLQIQEAKENYERATGCADRLHSVRIIEEVTLGNQLSLFQEKLVELLVLSFVITLFSFPIPCECGFLGVVAFVWACFISVALVILLVCCYGMWRGDNDILVNTREVLQELVELLEELMSSLGDSQAEVEMKTKMEKLKRFCQCEKEAWKPADIKLLVIEYLFCAVLGVMIWSCNILFLMKNGMLGLI